MSLRHHREHRSTIILRYSTAGLRRAMARMASLAALLLVAACGGDGDGQPAAAAQGREHNSPNIVFLLTDDLRWDEVGYAGYPVATPNIDRLASEGLRFDNAYVTSSLCSPSRASFLTGVYPHTHGVVGNRSELDFERTPTIAALLQEQGYRTGLIGKWHMGGSAKPRPGFDFWYALPGQGLYHDPKFMTPESANVSLLARLWHRLTRRGAPNGMVRVPGYSTDILTDQAVRFITENRDQPFYLHVAYKSVHQPFEPAPRHRDTLKRRHFKMTRPNATGPSAELRKQRAETLLSVDESVGRIVGQLEQLGLAENTIVVFTSDNGYLFREHDMGDKRVFYEESIRIPWVMYYPALREARKVVDEPVLNIDFLPSMLDLAGVPVPEHVQGRSYMPLVRRAEGENVDWRPYWVYEYFNEEEYMHLPTHFAVNGPRFKYVRFPEGPDMFDRFTGDDLLFDLQSDPYEMHDLAASPEYAGVIREKHAQLLEFAEETGVRFFDLSPEHVNQRIEQLYHDGIHTWFTEAMDKKYPDGYPGWQPPVREPL